MAVSSEHTAYETVRYTYSTRSCKQTKVI